ncbi:hypothetical protein PGT21_016960 [Puccinia graminis f. sp. tritici]|uniref:Uncharacterized protein n=1 Tax=Puccinia graminis f. sp. tritici TaxID=56615 RepID=A0A5B0MXA1_PUCGR|nr:hypothetical protein PGT21_016960 [Puccinia graminis f. sp. tritici]KAA1092036.1 hypothetical protein PGTUg99_002349 [Puccinia graminis f. sp. tritici]
MAIKDINDDSRILLARPNRVFLPKFLVEGLKIYPSLVEIIPPVRNTTHNQISKEIDEQSRFIQLDDCSSIENLLDDKSQLDEHNRIGTRTIKGMPSAYL